MIRQTSRLTALSHLARPVARSTRALVPSSRPLSSSAPIKGKKDNAWMVTALATLVVVPTFFWANKLELDSKPRRKDETSPDVVHASQGKGGEGKTGPTVSVQEVLQHKDGDEIWVVINGHVYNMTEFLDDHPGGKDIIVSNRSKDVSHIFKPRHPSDQLEADNLPPSVVHLGALDADGASEEEKDQLMLKVSAEEEDEENRIQAEREKMEQRGLGVIVNMRDFETYAEPLLSKVAMAYYASAGDDEITKLANGAAYQKVYFRPRILRKVAEADAKTTIMGKDSAIPVYIAPAAMAKLGHPLGEVNLTRGAGKTGIIQAISSNASCGIDEMVAARQPGQPLFYQLYVKKDRSKAEELVQRLNENKFDAIMLTADAPVGGKRERDLRLKGSFETADELKSDDNGAKTTGVSQAMFAGVDPDLNWEDLKWLRKLTDIPILVKGVQCVEDALLAYSLGADGIVISNHGGRQLDTTRPSLDVLLEIRNHAPHLLRPAYRGATGLTPEALKNPERVTPADVEGKMEKRFEILVDGGVHRGSDVVKALCLGANAVGIGRGFLFAQSVAGEQGVEHAVGILEEEILTTLRLLGVNKISQLRPSMVEVKDK